MTYTLTIPAFLPTSENVLRRVHHMRRAKLERGDADVIGFFFRESAIPTALCKRRVTLRLSGPAPMDEDNAKKSLLDGLVKCRAIVDDGPALCEAGGYAFTRSKRRETVVVLEDLE